METTQQTFFFWMELKLWFDLTFGASNAMGWKNTTKITRFEFDDLPNLFYFGDWTMAGALEHDRIIFPETVGNGNAIIPIDSYFSEGFFLNHQPVYTMDH